MANLPEGKLIKTLAADCAGMEWYPSPEVRTRNYLCIQPRPARLPSEEP